MTTPKKSDPLTLEEITEAADAFFPLFDVVHAKMQLRKGTVEETLKVMESIAKLGHKLRGDRLAKEKSESFGFVKPNGDPKDA